MDKLTYVIQLDTILDDYKKLVAESQNHNVSNAPPYSRQELVTRAVAAVDRVAGKRSSYAGEIQRILRDTPQLHAHFGQIIGVVRALHADLKNGHIQSLIELVHADTFADFLEMAQHLLDTHYKDAAAVIAGSALEAHLRALCAKANITTEAIKSGSVVAKKADALNAELAAASVYEKLDQKSVTAWLDLRNKAAHGHYSEYQENQVALLISGVRDFIGRKPA